MFIELPEEFLKYGDVYRRINANMVQSYQIEKSGGKDNPVQYLVRIEMVKYTNHSYESYYWCPVLDKETYGQDAEFYSEEDSLRLCQGMLTELDRRFGALHADRLLKG